MKRSGRHQGLLRLGLGPEGGARAWEARALSRMESAWPLLVGSALASYTRPLCLRHGTLVLGCHRNELIPNLRTSVATSSSILQERIQHMLRLRIDRIEVVPCDPPPPVSPSPPRPPEMDPLKAVLEKLRALRNTDWTPNRS